MNSICLFTSPTGHQRPRAARLRAKKEPTNKRLRVISADLPYLKNNGKAFQVAQEGGGEKPKDTGDSKRGQGCPGFRKAGFNLFIYNTTWGLKHKLSPSSPHHTKSHPTRTIKPQQCPGESVFLQLSASPQLPFLPLERDPEATGKKRVTWGVPCNHRQLASHRPAAGSGAGLCFHHLDPASLQRQSVSKTFRFWFVL